MSEEQKIIIDAEVTQETPDGLEVEPILVENDEEIRGIKGLRKFWNTVLDFEEAHPWLFFGIITIIIFLIIVSLLAPFLSYLTKPAAENTTVTQTETSTASPALIVKIQDSIGKESFRKSLLYFGKDAYPRLVEDKIINLDLDLRVSGFLQNELLALKDAETALSYNIQEALQISDNKRLTYTNYLELIKRLEKGVFENTANLYSEKRLIEAEITDLEQSLASSTNTLNQSLEQGSKKEVLQNLGPYLTNKEDLAILKNRLDLVNELLKVSRDPMQKLQARLAGIKANEQALIAGIEVIDIDQSGLALIKKGSVEDYR